MSELFEVPTIAMIIATYNRPNSLKRLLDCTAKQVHFDFGKLEVGIVNDGSQVHYPDINFDAYPFPITYIYRERLGVDELHPGGKPYVYSARNLAADAVKGDVVYMFDDENTFHPHTLFAAQLYHAIQDNIILLAHNAHAGDPEDYTAAFETKTKGPTGWTSSQGMSVRREWWDEVGGYDTDYDGCMGFADRDLAIRLEKAGCEVWLANGITIWADSTQDNDASWRDHFVHEWRREWQAAHPGEEMPDDLNWQILVSKHPELLED